MPTELIAAIIGGLIGLAGASIPLLWSIRYDAYRDTLANHLNYISWVRGLHDESKYLATCVEELETLTTWTTDPPKVTSSTKRLNVDFLASARTEIIHHERSPVIFPSLTHTIRDAVHTNEMLDDLESQAIAFTAPHIHRVGAPPLYISTKKSLEDIKVSLQELANICEEQTSFERRPILWRYLCGKS
jgi:hypothetical protein